MVAKKSVKICKYCEKEINLSEDKHVLLGTYSGENVDDETYFHFDCWKKYFLSCVEKKAENMQTATSFMDKLGGSGNMLGMLGGLSKLIPKNLKINVADLNDPKKIQEVLSGLNTEPKKKDDGKRKRNTKQKKV